MKNVTLVICSILLYGLISESLTETTGNLIIKKAIVNCVRSTGITWRELKRIHDLELTPHGRLELMKDKNNLRVYGCFLGCLWKMEDSNSSENVAFDGDKLLEDLQGVYNNNSDLIVPLNETMITCTEIVDEEDGCLLMLDLKFCIFENMRDYTL